MHAGTYITETPAYIPTDGVADWVKYTAREEKVSNPTAKSGLDNKQLKAAVQFQYSNEKCTFSARSHLIHVKRSFEIRIETKNNFIQSADLSTPIIYGDDKKRK